MSLLTIEKQYVFTKDLNNANKIISNGLGKEG